MEILQENDPIFKLRASAEHSGFSLKHSFCAMTPSQAFRFLFPLCWLGSFFWVMALVSAGYLAHYLAHYWRKTVLPLNTNTPPPPPPPPAQTKKNIPVIILPRPTVGRFLFHRLRNCFKNRAL